MNFSCSCLCDSPFFSNSLMQNYRTSYRFCSNSSRRWLTGSEDVDNDSSNFNCSSLYEAYSKGRVVFLYLNVGRLNTVSCIPRHLLNIYKAIPAVIFFQYRFVRRWTGVATKIVSNASCEMNGAIRFAKEPSAAEIHGELYLWTCNND